MLQPMRIKQILLTFLFSVFYLILFASDYYTATSDVNVRSGPGASYSISCTLVNGSEVELLAKGKDWYKVKYAEKSGYVHSKYLKLNESLSAANSNSSSQFENAIPILIFVCIALYLCFIIYKLLRDKFLLEIVTHKSRGTKSERNLVLTLLKYGIPAQNIFLISVYKNVMVNFLRLT